MSSLCLGMHLNIHAVDSVHRVDLCAYCFVFVCWHRCLKFAQTSALPWESSPWTFDESGTSPPDLQTLRERRKKISRSPQPLGIVASMGDWSDNGEISREEEDAFL